MAALEPILYIDDEPINLENFEFCFGNAYKVFIAQSADLAYKILSQNEIKVIISDQRMPEISGVELLEVVKNKYPDIIRIILTAFIHEEYLLEAINKGGVYRYITKPWNNIELDSVIKSAIETYNLKWENKQLIQELKEKISLLSISEEKFRNIFNSSGEGILIIDGQGRIINFNHAISDMLGYTFEETKGRPVTDFVVKEYHELLLQRLNHLIDPLNNDFKEYQVIKKDGQILFVDVKRNFIEYEGSMATIAVLHDITERKQFEKKLYIARVNAEEKERERIAKDLHDGIGPLLSTLKIYYYDIQNSTANKVNSQSIRKSGEIINEAIVTVKEISNNISPHVLRNFGLPQALEGFIERSRVTPNLKFHITSNLNVRVNDIIEITLYRIATELINNSIKYANANNINCAIAKNEKMLSFSYKDDGEGFDYDENIKKNKGFGLQNIQSRVMAIGGELIFDSKPGKGVNVSITINI